MDKNVVMFNSMDKGGRRTGMDRRTTKCSVFWPERRTTSGRRVLTERRAGRDRRLSLKGIVFGSDRIYLIDRRHASDRREHMIAEA